MSSLATLLKRESELLTRFKTTLLRERDVLQSGKTDGLEGINEEKLSLAGELNKLGSDRALAVAQQTAGCIDMQGWLQSNPSEREVATLWGGLMVLARETRDINNENGKLINLLHQKTSDSLSFLMQGHTDQSLYGSNGQSALSAGKRIIDSA